MPRSSLTLAWDVMTASDATATSHLQGMRDRRSPMSRLAHVDGHLVDGHARPIPTSSARSSTHVQTPSFLVDDSGHSNLLFGSDGQPMLRGIDTMPVVVQIPQCALTAKGPLPVIVFGHGLFSTAEDELATPLLQQVANEACVVFIGTDWIGLTSTDLPTLAELPPAGSQQRLPGHGPPPAGPRQRPGDDPPVPHHAEGRPRARPQRPGRDRRQRVYYFGISDGGIQGGTFMAWSQDIERGVLNVPGCEWSLLIYRSTDFAPIQPIITAAIPDPVNVQTVIALIQSEWDYTDPATYAPHLLHDPLPGVFTKRILMQESIGDAQVTNVATRVLARTMGIPGLDLIDPIYGVDAQLGPLDSAYTQWNSNPMPLPPAGDLALMQDNGAHDAVYQYVPAQQQILDFMTPSGQVIETCGGPCNFSQ